MKTLDYLHLDENAAGKLVQSLQQLLADFQVHYMNLRGFHWNIQGHGFFVLHSKFEEMYDDTAEKVDQIAERILMLGGVPSNKFSEYLKIAKVREIDGVSCGGEALGHVLDTYKYLIGRERELLAQASEAGDEVTVSMMTDYLQEQEKTVWMLLGSQAWRFLRPIASGLDHCGGAAEMFFPPLFFRALAEDFLVCTTGRFSVPYLSAENIARALQQAAHRSVGGMGIRSYVE